jgi:hypothetical protein
MGARFPSESVAGFVRNHRPISPGIRNLWLFAIVTEDGLGGTVSVCADPYDNLCANILLQVVDYAFAVVTTYALPPTLLPNL